MSADDTGIDMRGYVKWITPALLPPAVAASFATCGGSIDSPLFDSVTGPGDPSGFLDGSADATHRPSDGDAHADAGRRDGSGPPPLPYDGVCTPRSVMSGVYDPDCMYLLGTSSEGLCGHDALVSPNNPSEYAFGFGCATWRTVIRPTDGRLLFLGSTGLPNEGPHVYVYEQPTTVDETPMRRGRIPQPILPTPPCVNPSDLRVFPDDGKLFYRCEQGPNYYVEGTSEPLTFEGYVPTAVGENRTVFLEATAPDTAIFIAGKVVPIKPLGSGWDSIAVRSRRGGGFLLAYRGEETRAALCEVKVTGEAIPIGEYKLSDRFRTGPGCTLESSGALVCTTDNVPNDADAAPGQRHDGLVRFTFDAPPELLYDEAGKPIKLHGLTFAERVTGP